MIFRLSPSLASLYLFISVRFSFPVFYFILVVLLLSLFHLLFLTIASLLFVFLPLSLIVTFFLSSIFHERVSLLIYFSRALSHKDGTLSISPFNFCAFASQSRFVSHLFFTRTIYCTPTFFAYLHTCFTRLLIFFASPSLLYSFNTRNEVRAHCILRYIHARPPLTSNLSRLCSSPSQHFVGSFFVKLINFFHFLSAFTLTDLTLHALSGRASSFISLFVPLPL